ncbi:MAG: MBL fold metallo-hydrolase [Desulfurivibrionaceae bacterium]|nr:MBL fold metallo-hydrolase [Desulfobulbales bacterium]MDT8334663.1 MBL fold metallo-hydrolase [Desulfurivibrionaceae bacterium]
MRFCVLGSGSRGNATFVEAGETRILLDAGFSGVEVERRLAAIGIDIATISALLVTHEHGDHIRGVQVLSRRYSLPVYVSKATREAAGKSLAGVFEWRPIEAGLVFSHRQLTIHPFAVCHDAVDTLGFVVGNGEFSVGYCTDTGSISHLMSHHLGGCNGLVLECNHDPEMLKNGGYPPSLQQRIRSKSGHLTNTAAASFLVELIHNGLKHVVLAHVSETNNSHDLVRTTVEGYLQEYDLAAGAHRGFSLSVARQDAVGELVCLAAADSSSTKK